MPLKINDPIIPYIEIFLISVQRHEPNSSKRTFFHSICLIDDRLKHVDCQETSFKNIKKLYQPQTSVLSVLSM